MQPISLSVEDGMRRCRFKENAIVAFLLKSGPYDMNKLSMMPWSNEDWEQLFQLLGYEVSAYCELPCVTTETYNTADEACRSLYDADRRMKNPNPCGSFYSEHRSPETCQNCGHARGAHAA